MARKAPRITKATAQKIANNPRTPPGLKKYWAKRVKSM